MAIGIGSQLGSHVITALLGRGGMGEVYRARDTNLKREVAIKILPAEFSLDSERVARFQREAEVLASLNHSNIGAIYDLGEADGARFLVLELVEGETLAERIRRGALPILEALDIGKHVAEALEAAHEKGVVHRDLKPGNVKITPAGKVKVLDFGLAKVRQSQARSDFSNSPTLMSGSAPGVIMGTAAYMSPEQAKGKEADAASDIWALGCVLFEMLTGRAAFEGESLTEILGGVLKAEPDWSGLPAGTPEGIRRLLRRCLKKDRSGRLKSADDARIEIEDALAEPSSAALVAPPMRRARLGWIVATAVATLAFVGIATVHFSEKPPGTPPEMRVDITTPSTQAPLEFALSPDGQSIVFVASGDGPQRLWLRPLNKTEAAPLEGTEGANYPFWSADSRSIGFTASGKLKRIDVAGGQPQPLANVRVIRPGAWNAEGTILFNVVAVGPLYRMAASGGEPSVVTRLDPPRQVQQRNPQFLPDGRRFLFYVAGSPEVQGIYLGSLDGGEPKRLAAADRGAVYLPPGMIAFVRQTSLMAQHLDLERGELTGDPVTIADPVGLTSVNVGGFSASGGGLAYRSGSAGSRQLKWFDRTGKVLGIAAEPDSASLLYPELSPDGRYVAVGRTPTQGNTDIWLLDLIRGGRRRLTSDPAIEIAPVWSQPDGAGIAFTSSVKGAFNIYLKPSTNAGAEELLRESPNTEYPQDWSKDARFLLYGVADLKTGRDLYAWPMTDGERKPIEIARSQAEELNGQFSPDSHWVAYETDESGDGFEIVVQPFPVVSRKLQVSTGGGIQPRWRADGKELYFIAPDGRLMAASIAVNGATISG